MFIISANCWANLKDVQEFKSGDIIPSDILLYNAYGEPSKIADIENEYKVIFYLDDIDYECIIRLNCISKMIKLLNLNAISYLILWEDRLPIEKINDAGIELNYNYSLKGKSTLSEFKPNAFFIDSKNRILMITGYSYISLINKLIKLNSEKDLDVKAGKMILKNARKLNISFRESKEKTMLLFISPGCKKCRNYKNIILQNVKYIQEKINVIIVRTDFDNNNDFGIQKDSDIFTEIDHQQLYFNIYTNALGIEPDRRKYPMFIIINNNKSIEKSFTELDEAVDYTLGLN